MLNAPHSCLPNEAFQRLAQVSAFIFDVDRTLTEPHEQLNCNIIAELQRLRIPAGVATARTLSELEESIPPGVPLTDVFRGDLLLEDGGVLVPRRQHHSLPLKVEALVSHAELRAVSTFRQFLYGAFVDLNRQDGFGLLGDLKAPLIKFPPHRDFLTSITLWEKGAVGDPSFVFAYDWCGRQLKEQGLEGALELTEVGDGTLRITVSGTSKGRGLEHLSIRNRLPLSQVAYFGDGYNDLPAALVVRAHGGLVIAVGSTTPPLTALADYTIAGEGPEAVLRFLRQFNQMAKKA